MDNLRDELRMAQPYRSYALTRKHPRAGREWAWQYALPSKNRSADPDDGVFRRHHLDESVPQRAVKKAARAGYRV